MSICTNGSSKEIGIKNKSRLCSLSIKVQRFIRDRWRPPALHLSWSCTHVAALNLILILSPSHCLRLWKECDWWCAPSHYHYLSIYFVTCHYVTEHFYYITFTSLCNNAHFVTHRTLVVAHFTVIFGMCLSTTPSLPAMLFASII